MSGKDVQGGPGQVLKVGPYFQASFIQAEEVASAVHEEDAISVPCLTLLH